MTEDNRWCFKFPKPLSKSNTRKMIGFISNAIWQFYEKVGNPLTKLEIHYPDGSGESMIDCFTEPVKETDQDR